jgi:hypothetical protein
VIDKERSTYISPHHITMSGRLLQPVVAASRNVAAGTCPAFGPPRLHGSSTPTIAATTITKVIKDGKLRNQFYFSYRHWYPNASMPFDCLNHIGSRRVKNFLFCMPIFCIKKTIDRCLGRIRDQRMGRNRTDREWGEEDEVGSNEIQQQPATNSRRRGDREWWRGFTH